jgi:hypothetical protein
MTAERPQDGTATFLAGAQQTLCGRCDAPPVSQGVRPQPQ